MKPGKTLNSELLHDGPAVRLVRESVQLPNDRHCELEIIKHPGGSACVAVDATRSICLLRQYRHAIGDWLWELPAGKREQGEAPEKTAARELSEEAGVSAGQFLELGTVTPSPAICDEVIHLYLARDLTAANTDHEPDEVIEVHWVPLAKAVKMVTDNEITDAKTVAGILRARELL